LVSMSVRGGEASRRTLLWVVSERIFVGLKYPGGLPRGGGIRRDSCAQAASVSLSTFPGDNVVPELILGSGIETSASPIV
jgi:hypothetical protein